MTGDNTLRVTALPRQAIRTDDDRRRYLDEIFRPGPRPAPLALDISAPAVRAIIRLFLDIKVNETQWTIGDDPRGRLDLHDVVEAWFARIGLGLEQSATSLVLGLVRGWRDPGLELAEGQSCYGQECYGEGCCGQEPELPDAYRHPGSCAPQPEETDAVPVALTLLSDRCGGGPADPSDPDVLTEVAADLMGDIFDVAEQAGLEPAALVERALHLLNEQRTDELPEVAQARRPAARPAVATVNLDDVAELVRAHGVECVLLDTVGRRQATLWARPLAAEAGHGPRWTAQAGPAPLCGDRSSSVVRLDTLDVGPLQDGTDTVNMARIGARTPQAVAAVIAAQACKPPATVLDFAEIEALGLDGTCRS